MNKKFLVLLLLFSLTLAGCQKVEKEEEEDNNDNNGAISVQPVDNEESMESYEEEVIIEEEEKVVVAPIVVVEEEETVVIDPTLCEVDMDCVAIPHPANGCYKEYFNKNATETITEYRNRAGMMVQDCPHFGAPVCIDNKCTGKK